MPRIIETVVYTIDELPAPAPRFSPLRSVDT